MPEAPDYKITNAVSGGEAVVAVNSAAKKGEEVTIAVSDIESGKQIKRVTAVDTAGNALQLVKDGGEYTFTMPGRAVVISVVLENAVAPDAAEYKIILPAELDTSADMGVYNKSVSGVSSKTSSEMKSQDSLKSLGSAFAADTDKINNGYPVFKWQSSPDEQGGGMGGTTETQEPGQNPGVITPAGTYSDVAANAWYKSAVDYVTDKKLMNGTGNGKFNPEGNTTRAMLMTILTRLSGENTDGGSPWYQKGLDWSVAKGISDGSNPEKNITREQLAAMLYRYAGSPKTTGNLDSFNDAGQVSDYAKTAMQWAVEKGIVTGKGGGKLDPGSNASRAEVAAMLQRFMNLSASEK